MINKVLVAEDHESVNVSLQRALEEFGIKEIDHAYYCDDAHRKVQVAMQHGQSYDLLITDLSFEDDGSPQKLTDGMLLIPAVRQVQPDLKIIVFSAKNEAVIIDKLINQLYIDAYVQKARNDARELRAAMEAISGNQTYFPRSVRELVKGNNAINFTEYDITLINLLAEGRTQQGISDQLRLKGIKPSSLSSIEKQLKKIREEFNCTKNEQLIAICKDLGIL